MEGKQLVVVLVHERARSDARAVLPLHLMAGLPRFSSVRN